MEQVQQVESLFGADTSSGPRDDDAIDLRFDVPVIDLRERDLDLDFATSRPSRRPCAATW